MVLINLSNLDFLLIKEAVKYSFSSKDNYLAILKKKWEKQYPINSRPKKQSFGNIKSFMWQRKRELLVMTIETKDSTANSIQLYEPNQGKLKVLDNSSDIYSNLKWGERSDYLFALKSLTKKQSKEKSYQLLHWKDFSTLNPKFSHFNPNETKSFPRDTRILPNSIKISDNGNSVFFETFSWVQTKEKTQEKRKVQIVQKNQMTTRLQKWKFGTARMNL